MSRFNDEKSTGSSSSEFFYTTKRNQRKFKLKWTEYNKKEGIFHYKKREFFLFFTCVCSLADRRHTWCIIFSVCERCVCVFIFAKQQLLKKKKKKKRNDCAESGSARRSIFSEKFFSLFYFLSAPACAWLWVNVVWCVSV